jgi:hypothetical protein
MVVSDQKIREGFSARLESALRASAKAPDDPRRWRSWVSKRYGVSIESARKWLSGLALPELATVAAIAMDLGETVEHLLTGRAGEIRVASPALSAAENALVESYRSAPPVGQAILRNAAAAASDALSGTKARTLHVVAEQSSPPTYKMQAPAHELDRDLLALVLEQAERLTSLTAAQRAAIVVKVYEAAATDDRKPSAAKVLRLLRSA